MDRTTPHQPLPHAECVRFGELIARVGDRWTLPVTVTLLAGPLRFNQLRRAINGVSQQMLTRTLKSLERDGMVTRTVHPSVPPQVEYALTALGVSLAEEGMRIGAWARDNMAAIHSSRERYDAGERG
ncbi:helix-turn-helix domain-containing protein [Sphingomonas sp.]|uniref:winged helix-turn-helix transcriptional regulator n=1 Tax=Sphingomonas sp. TaxID=28214 RepID=UPI001B22BDA8|nr:helix-turn-helix domain-containing protein [Sphingomonas sp.]MBO9713822.1 helix-turn-helix transcriptional regulator [Sphingomonas sp.]